MTMNIDINTCAEELSKILKNGTKRINIDISARKEIQSILHLFSENIVSITVSKKNTCQHDKAYINFHEFPNLKILRFEGYFEYDIYSLVELEELYLNNYYCGSLNLSKYTKLKRLRCGANKSDISKLTNLTELNSGDNPSDLSKLTNLRKLILGHGHYKDGRCSMVGDLSNLTKLEFLDCGPNTVDVSKCLSLRVLHLGINNPSKEQISELIYLEELYRRIHIKRKLIRTEADDDNIAGKYEPNDD